MSFHLPMKTVSLHTLMLVIAAVQVWAVVAWPLTRRRPFWVPLVLIALPLLGLLLLRLPPAMGYQFPT